MLHAALGSTIRFVSGSGELGKRHRCAGVVARGARHGAKGRDDQFPDHFLETLSLRGGAGLEIQSTRVGVALRSLCRSRVWSAAESEVVDYIRHHARTGIFSAAMPPSAAAAVIAAIDIIEAEPERRKQLWESTRYMKKELDGMGFETGESDSPVIPIVVGEDITSFAMSMRLLEEGVFVNPVISPAVPPGQAMIRTSYMATHERDHLDRALEGLSKVGREFDII